MQIRDLIYKTAGIFQANNKLRLLEERCLKRMQILGVKTLREYYDLLTNRPMRHAELVSLLNEITIGETCFFRNQPQLEGIRKIVLPRLVQKSSQFVRHIRVWSGGCSTGEEPYTLAMILLEESVKSLRGWTFEVIATDINERSLGLAQQGVFGDYSVRNTDSYFLQKYFRTKDGKFTIIPEVKSRVKFSRLNLFDDAGMMFMKGMDIILCCNVLIYFDCDSKKRVIQHFYANLVDHGYLFLGHAESLFAISEDFQLVHMPSTTAYVKSGKRHLAGAGSKT
jgi:chemotaxis protein methyltransferase CheR